MPFLTDVDPAWFLEQTPDDQQLIWRSLTDAGQALLAADLRAMREADVIFPTRRPSHRTLMERLREALRGRGVGE